MIQKDPQRMKKNCILNATDKQHEEGEENFRSEIHVYPNLIFFIRRRGDDRQL